MFKRASLLAALLFVAGCPDGEPIDPVDGSTPSRRDAGRPDGNDVIHLPDTGTPAGEDAGTPPDASAPLQIDWCVVQFPESAKIATGERLTVFGQVFVQGQTEQAGARTGIEGQLGYGAQGSDGSSDTSWTWTGASFNEDKGNNDEYRAEIAPAQGSWAYAYRFRGAGGAWTYCDTGAGSSDGYDRTRQGALTVEAPLPAVIGWCNTDAPLNARRKQGVALEVTGKVYAKGVTDVAAPTQTIVAELGFGAAGSDPRTATWTWKPAALKSGAENNDLYAASIAPAAGGSYAYAYRFTLGGAQPVYCDLRREGSEPGFDAANLGALEVTGADVVDWCNLQWPASGALKVGESLDVFGQVFVEGVTEGAATSADIEAQLGVGPAGTDLSKSEAAWGVAASFLKKVEGVAHHEYQASAAATAAGSFAYAYRFRYQGGSWTYCDLDGSHDGYDPAKQGLLTVTEVQPPKIGWCRTFAPGSATLTLGDEVQVSGQVLATGITDQTGAGAGVFAQVGFGPKGTDPRQVPLDWSWGAATYAKDVGNNDEFEGSVKPAQVGLYSVTYRFRLGTTGEWTYCDGAGNDDTHPFDPPAQVGLEVKAPAVGWCNLQFPDKANVAVSTSFPAFGRVWVDGVTNAAGKGAEIEGELGFGAAGSNGSTDTSWTWGAAAYHQDSDNGSNDEYQASFTAPAAAGTYAYAYRFRYKGGAWTYCDLGAGSSDGYEPGKQGELTVTAVKPPEVDWCRLQFPASAAVELGGKTTIFGQVYVAGTTEPAGAGAEVEGEVGIGAPGTDGSTDATWVWSAASYNADVGNNDEYQADLQPTAVGDYAYAFRFRFQGGQWLYCDLEPGTTDGYSPARQGALSVASVKPPSVDWCQLESPASLSATEGDTVSAFGRVWVNGVTEVPGAGSMVEGELGVGPAGSDGSSAASWTWTAAAFDADVGNDDRFKASHVAAATGSFAYAYRFRFNNGPWTYCDLDASANGFEPAQQGALTVKPPAVDYCVLQHPASGEVSAGGVFTIYGQVYQAGVTEAAGAGADLQAQGGFGAIGSDGSTDTSWTWLDATFNVDAGNNDEFKAALSPAIGNYGYAYRVRYKGGPWTYCDLDGSNNGYAAGMQGTLAVKSAAPAVVLHSLNAPVENVGTKFFVNGAIFVPGVTDAPGQGAGISAEVGIGAHGSQPGAGWTWAAATYFELPAAAGASGQDRYGGFLTAPATGSYDVAMRFVTGGQTYYADLDGSAAYDPAKAAQLTTLPEPDPASNDVGWCNLQWPHTVTITAGSSTPDIYGQVWISGVSDHTGSDARISAQLGVGPANSSPRTGEWGWGTASYNADKGNNDEYKSSFIQTIPGTYRYLYRFRLNSGSKGWTYCDTDGTDSSNPFDETKSGTLTVQ